QAFNIKSTDPWWKTCIDLLMHSCDIIVTDVSRVGEGSAWEIHQLAARNLLKKCIFIVEESFAKDGLQSVSHLLPEGLSPQLFVFRQDGSFVDRISFDSALLESFQTANYFRCAGAEVPQLLGAAPQKELETVPVALANPSRPASVESQRGT